MAVKTRVETVDRDFAVLIREDLSPEAQAKQFAMFARTVRDQAIDQNEAVLGRKPTYTTSVDGRIGATEETVKVPGRIVYEFDIGTTILAEIGDMLVLNSPVLTGKFARSFKMFVDGTEYIPGEAMPVVQEEIVFLNIQPYARKIEGTPNRPPQSDQTPDGVFQAVAIMAQRKYGNVATVRFTYRAFVEGGVMNYGGGSNSRRVEQQARVPAIVVRLK